MDLTIPAAPRSDQLNADDLISGPATFTIDRVEPGTDEQPVCVHLVERPGRPWKPSKTMLRVLIEAWGKETDAWEGVRRVTLFRDASVKFGRDQVGGIRISHLSHIDKPLHLAITEKRGVKKPWRVDPLADTSGPTLADVQAATSEGDLRALWQSANETVRAAITARVAELRGDTGGDAA